MAYDRNIDLLDLVSDPTGEDEFLMVDRQGVDGRQVRVKLRDLIGDFRSTGYRTLYIGDSITHQAHSATYTDNVNKTGTLTGFQTNIQSWLTWLEILSRGAIRVPVWADNSPYPAVWLESNQFPRGFFGSNFGINGQTSEKVLARVTGNGAAPSAKDFDFDMAFCHFGSNDVSAAINPDTTVVNTLATLDALLAMGKYVIFLPIRARGLTNWTPGGASNSRKKARYINQKVREEIAKRSGIMYLDWERAWSDSTATNSPPFAGYSNDEVHDAPLGGFAIADYLWNGVVNDVQVWTGLKTMFPPRSRLYVSQDDDYDATYNTRGNLYPNGLMLGTSGAVTTANGATGVVANSLTVERSASTGSTTVVASKETPADNNGFLQVLTFTNAGTASETFYLRTTSSAFNLPAGFAGKWIEATVDVEVAQAYDKITGIELYVQDVANNITYRGGANLPGFFLPNKTWKGTLFCPPIFLFGNPTQFRVRINTILTGGGTGNLVLKAGKFNVREMEDPRVQFGWLGPTYGE